MAGKAQIVMPSTGIHNTDLEKSRVRLLKGKSYRDCSTICIIPTRGVIHAHVLQSWFSLQVPMNNRFIRLFGINMEVADSYNQMIASVLANPELATWKYILTLEEDNIPPPDGLLKLIEALEEHKLDVVGGLYWTKGIEGQPMIYGSPEVTPKSFLPQVPITDVVQRCNGLGMGFNLFRLSIFKDERIPRPWFRTIQEFIPGQGVKAMTQDLYFYENAGNVGYKFASANHVRVGHFDASSELTW